MGTRLALLLAVILGFVAAIGFKMYMEQQGKEIKEEHKPRMIVVAKRTLQPGEPLRSQDMALSPFPQKYLRRGMIPEVEKNIHVRKILSRKVMKGEPIFLGDLTDEATDLTFTSPVVGEGLRAVTIPVDQVSGVGGLIRPGDYVDVIGTFNMAEETQGGNRPVGAITAQRTRTVYMMQAVKVIALDNRTINVAIHSRRPTAQYRTVTLELRPEDAVRLINARAQGQVQLILRQSGDVQIEAGFDAETRHPTTNFDVREEVRRTSGYMNN